MASDRTQYKQVLIGVVGALRTVSNSFLMVAQDAQRYDGASVGGSNTAATGTQSFAVARLDRPVLLKEARILPGGTLTFNASNFQTINVQYTNDGGGAATVLAQTATSAALNTVFPGATGNWTQGVSILIPQNASVNQVVPSGSQLVVQAVNTGAGGVAIPAGTVFQVIWEEV